MRYCFTAIDANFTLKDELAPVPGGIMCWLNFPSNMLAPFFRLRATKDQIK